MINVVKSKSDKTIKELLLDYIGVSPVPSEVLAGMRQYLRIAALSVNIDAYQHELKYSNTITKAEDKIFNIFNDLGYKLFGSFLDYMIFTHTFSDDDGLAYSLPYSLVLVDLTQKETFSIVVTCIDTSHFTTIEERFTDKGFEQELITSAVLSLTSGGDVRTQSFKLDDNKSKYPLLEFYPDIYSTYNSLEELYDEYLNSKEAILLLIGAPGTAKTTFIRGLMKYANRNVGITYDKKLMVTDPDTLFEHTDRYDIFVFEDSDVMLHKRTDGNDQMAKILNVSDGLVPNKDRKMVFSTNLPSVKDIDEAMLRPGRCFGVFDFRRLNHTEAQKVVTVLDIPEIDLTTQKDWSVGEITNIRKSRNETKARVTGGIGFY